MRDFGEERCGLRGCPGLNENYARELMELHTLAWRRYTRKT